MSNLKILVTGASGVVGRRLVPALAAAGHQVRAMARTDAQRETLARVGAAAVSADLFDPRSLRRATVGCDAVINLATHMPSSGTQMLRRSAWKENDRIRAVGSANLVDAALAEGVGRFVQESFAPVYPDRGDDWIDEQTPLRRRPTTGPSWTPRTRRRASPRAAGPASCCASPPSTGPIRGSCWRRSASPARKGVPARLTRRVRLLDLARRRRIRGGRRALRSGGRLQRGGRRAPDPARLLRLARAGARRPRPASISRLDEAVARDRSPSCCRARRGSPISS